MRGEGGEGEERRTGSLGERGSAKMTVNWSEVAMAQRCVPPPGGGGRMARIREGRTARQRRTTPNKQQLFLRAAAKTYFGGEAPLQQGRQECRPSDGPATLLSPMVGMKAVSSSRGQNLFWWGGSPAAGATRVSPIRRTGDTPVADGGPGKLFLRAAAKTCFGVGAPMQQGRPCAVARITPPAATRARAPGRRGRRRPPPARSRPQFRSRRQTTP